MYIKLANSWKISELEKIVFIENDIVFDKNVFVWKGT